MFGYGPYMCISATLVILLVIWVVWGEKNKYEFVGLGPLTPATCSSYEGSLYNWSKIPDESSIVDADVCEREPEEEPHIPVPTILEETPNYKSMAKEIIKTNALRRNEKRVGKQVSIGEQICKATMERKYGVPFENKRPAWLQNPETKGVMELDCYNGDLKIAVEYNGAQHYKWPNQYADMTLDAFVQQVRRDKLKMDICDVRGVYLIIVPYTVNEVDIPEYILSRLPEDA